MAQDNRNGAPEEHEIQPDAPVMDVPAVHLYALGVVDVAASAGLPHAGDAGEDGVILLDIFPIPRDFFLNDGAGSDEAHLTFENIQELRQLIEAGLSEESAALCDAGIFSLNSLSHSSFAAGSVARRWSKTSCEFVHMERNL